MVLTRAPVRHRSANLQVRRGPLGRDATAIITNLRRCQHCDAGFTVAVPLNGDGDYDGAIPLPRTRISSPPPDDIPIRYSLSFVDNTRQLFAEVNLAPTTFLPSSLPKGAAPEEE